MLRVARLAKVTNHMVRVEIDGHPNEEEQDACNGIRTKQVGNALLKVGIGKPVKPSALNHAVDDVKEDAHEHDDDWHLALSFQQKGEDKAALEIVQLKEPEEYQLRQVPLQGREAPYCKHDKEDRKLHQHPSQLVVDAPSPLLRAELPVACRHEVKADKDHDSQHHHAINQTIKETFIYHFANYH